MEPCVPTRAANPPSRAHRVYEIRRDGHRLSIHRCGDGVRLSTRRHCDWIDRDLPSGARWMDSAWPFIKLIPLEMKSHGCSDAPT